jgi:hypothetical protein
MACQGISTLKIIYSAVQERYKNDVLNMTDSKKRAEMVYAVMRVLCVLQVAMRIVLPTFVLNPMHVVCKENVFIFSSLFLTVQKPKLMEYLAYKQAMKISYAMDVRKQGKVREGTDPQVIRFRVPLVPTCRGHVKKKKLYGNGKRFETTVPTYTCNSRNVWTTVDSWPLARLLQTNTEGKYLQRLEHESLIVYLLNRGDKGNSNLLSRIEWEFHVAGRSDEARNMKLGHLMAPYVVETIGMFELNTAYIR